MRQAITYAALLVILHTSAAARQTLTLTPDPNPLQFRSDDLITGKVTVINGSAEEITVTMKASENWIKLNDNGQEVSLTIAPNGNGVVNVDVDDANLPSPGDHAGEITGEISGSMEDPEKIPVALTVLTIVAVSETLLDFGSTEITRSFTVSHNNESPITLNFVSSDPEWLGVSLSNMGGFVGSQNITVDADEIKEIYARVNRDRISSAGDDVHNAIITISSDIIVDGSLAVGVYVNRIPEYIGSLPEQITLTEGCEWTFTLDTLFVDPDNDVLLFTAPEASPSSVLDIQRDGSVVRITPQQDAGDLATVTLFAGDQDFMYAEHKFEVRVEENSPPEVVNPEIAEIRLKYDTELRTVCTDTTLTNLFVEFTDPDTIACGPIRNLTAEVLEPQIVEFTKISTNSFVFTPLRTGTTTVMITAHDHLNAQASKMYRFVVDENAEPLAAYASETEICVTFHANSAAFHSLQDSLTFSDADDPQNVLQLADFEYFPIQSGVNISMELSPPRLRFQFMDGMSVSNEPNTVLDAGVSFRIQDPCGARSDSVFIPIRINREPIVENRIPDLRLETRALTSEKRINLIVRNIFSDLDAGDSLTFSARQSDSEVAFVQIIGDSILDMSPLKVGQTIVTVTAEDGWEGDVETSFILRIVDTNQPPELSQVLPDLGLTVGEPAEQINLKGFFEDPNSDSLRFTAKSQNEAIAFAAIVGEKTLWVEAKKANDDSVRIDITATDGNSKPVEGFMMVKVNKSAEPVFAGGGPVSPNAVIAGGPIEVFAHIIDDFGVPTVSMLFRTAGANDTIRTPMSRTVEPSFLDRVSPRPTAEPGKSVHTYRGEISGQFATSSGVEYQFEFFDPDSQIVREPNLGNDFQFASISVNVSEGGAEQPGTIHTGSGSDDYRLVSFPLQITNNNPEDVFRKALGERDNRKWRFFEPRFNSTALDLPEIPEIIPGRAYWLLVRETKSAKLTAGPGTTVLTDEHFEIQLHPGWNYIGSPFDFDVPLAKTALANGEAPAQGRVMIYDGAWRAVSASGVLNPFAGYALFVNDVDTLRINPNVGSTQKTTQTPLVILWKIRIIAEIMSSRDQLDFIVSNDAQFSFDALDQPEPPHWDEFVSVYFTRPGWRKATERFTADARPVFSDGETWEFEAVSSRTEEITLTFDGVQDVPAEFDVWLVDEDAGIAKNLRETRRYVVAGRGLEHPKRLKLVVGRSDFAEPSLAAVNIMPESFELSQNYPNPFNPSTTIRYALPEASAVTMQVFNMLGESIRTLIDRETVNAGFHTVVWDGRDDFGRVAASGVYVYTIRAGEFNGLRKMALVK